MARKNLLPHIARQAIRCTITNQSDTELRAYASDLEIKIYNLANEVQYHREILRMAEAELERRRRGSPSPNPVG